MCPSWVWKRISVTVLTRFSRSIVNLVYKTNYILLAKCVRGVNKSSWRTWWADFQRFHKHWIWGTNLRPCLLRRSDLHSCEGIGWLPWLRHRNISSHCWSYLYNWRKWHLLWCPWWSFTRASIPVWNHSRWTRLTCLRRILPLTSWTR